MLALCTRSRVALTAAVVMLGAARLASAQALAGARASGSSEYGYLPCANLTCDGTSGSWSEDLDTGLNSALASGDGFFATRSAYFASVDFTGPRNLPVLRALAHGGVELGTHPNYSSNCCYITNSQATAQGVQYYSYRGTTTQTYTLRFDVEGVISAGPEGGIAGALGIFDGSNANPLELPYGNNLGFDNVTLTGMQRGVPNSFAEFGSVTFTLNPGMGFYALASLIAQVVPFGEGYADGANTMRLRFTQGDASLLDATIIPTTVVPEPSMALLVATGLALLVAVQRQRARRATR